MLLATLTYLYHGRPSSRACGRQGDNTALHWAAMRGHVEIVKLLLSYGADRTAQNAQGRTAMDLAQPQWSYAYKFVRTELSR